VQLQSLIVNVRREAAAEILEIGALCGTGVAGDLAAIFATPS